MTGAVTDPEPGPDRRATLVSLFRGQADWCTRLGSPMYGQMLEWAADDLERGGPVWRVVEPYLDKPFNFAHHLRLLGATHRLALTGEAPQLAAHYPTTGGDGDVEAAWRPFLPLIGGREASAADWLAERLARERGGSATVVYHSIMWGYMTDDDRARVTATLNAAGGRATTTEPLAWLRMEPGADQTDVTLTTWPGGEQRV